MRDPDAAKDSKFGPAEGGGALARRRRATGSGHIAEAGEADTSPELIVGATDSSRQAQSPHAASVYYAVIDRVSNNLLGEFDHRQHAEEFRHELAEARGDYHGLVIVEVEAES